MGEALIVRRGGGVDTSDATATASKILNGFTAYVDGEKVTGSIATYSGSTSVTPSYRGGMPSGTTLPTSGKYMSNDIYVRNAYMEDYEFFPDDAKSVIEIPYSGRKALSYWFLLLQSSEDSDGSNHLLCAYKNGFDTDVSYVYVASADPGEAFIREENDDDNIVTYEESTGNLVVSLSGGCRAQWFVGATYRLYVFA